MIQAGVTNGVAEDAPCSSRADIHSAVQSAGREWLLGKMLWKRRKLNITKEAMVIVIDLLSMFALF